MFRERYQIILVFIYVISINKYKRKGTTKLEYYYILESYVFKKSLYRKLLRVTVNYCIFTNVMFVTEKGYSVCKKDNVSWWVQD